ncbi:MAG: hydrogenase expression protein HypE [Alphaproteobacteria bacterium]|nr:hydrogenase expression protein HypE [Alphaproteobacteria bacterium]
MTAIGDLTRQGQIVAAHRPWPRAVVTPAVWQAMTEALADGHLTLLGLWAEGKSVHAAVHAIDAGDLAVLSLDCPDGKFPSVGKAHAPAIRLERTARDVHGLEPIGAVDNRPWLDHGQWKRPQDKGRPATQYQFLPAEGESLHEIPVGPVHAGIIEPGHFRFTANGETVVRLEERLGYVHKGIEGLMAGTPLDRAARLAGRVSGDSTVAYSFAIARAVEAALALDVPPRAQLLRGLMAELERLANHFGDIGAICNDASFVMIHAHCGVLREGTLRLAERCFGHRLMMDRIVPGGVATDLPPDANDEIKTFVANARKRFKQLVGLYDKTASLQDRTVRTGILSPALARKFGAGGYVGRASGRGFDTRCALPYAPYDALRLDVPVLNAGDVDARIWIRIREVEQSLSLVEQILARLEPGAILTAAEDQQASGEGMALVEGFRGDILVWLRIEAGIVAHCHLRDPSWFQWPLLEAVIEGNIVADFPLCNKSFNCSYSGHDL